MKIYNYFKKKIIDKTRFDLRLILNKTGILTLINIIQHLYIIYVIIIIKKHIFIYSNIIFLLFGQLIKK